MDPSLVSRAQQGDEEAFALLAVAVGNGLLAVAHRSLRDVDLAKDATQQRRLQGSRSSAMRVLDIIDAGNVHQEGK